MKRIVCLFLFMVCSYSVFSQNSDRFQSGSAKSLRGTIFSELWFVSDSNNEWTENEITNLMFASIMAMSWIENQSSQYNVDINFFLPFLETNIKQDNISEDTGLLLSNILRTLGYNNRSEYYEMRRRQFDSVKEVIPFSNPFTVIFVKQDLESAYLRGRSHARDGYILDVAVVYYEPHNLARNYYELVIAHEILHLFGARDFYWDPVLGINSRDFAESIDRLFNNSVMSSFRHGFDLNRYSIDEITAWLIGWHNDLKEWYRRFLPEWYFRE